MRACIQYPKTFIQYDVVIKEPKFNRGKYSLTLTGEDHRFIQLQVTNKEARQLANELLAFAKARDEDM